MPAERDAAQLSVLCVLAVMKLAPNLGASEASLGLGWPGLVWFSPLLGPPLAAQGRHSRLGFSKAMMSGADKSHATEHAAAERRVEPDPSRQTRRAPCGAVLSAKAASVAQDATTKVEA